MEWIGNIIFTVVQSWLSWQSQLSVWDNIKLIAYGFMFWTILFLIITFIFWVLFLACMNVQRVYENRKAEKKVGQRKYMFRWYQWIVVAPLVAIMMIVDILFRYTYGVIIFFPYFRGFFSDVTFSKELEAILATEIYKGTFNYKLALFIAQELINPFSYDGEHIRTPLEPKKI